MTNLGATGRAGGMFRPGRPCPVHAGRQRPADGSGDDDVATVFR